MNLDAIFEHAKQMRQNSFSNSPQLSLGVLIDEIKKAGLTKDNGEPKAIEYDFGTAFPTTLDSWRGSYSELALGYSLSGYDKHDAKKPTAEQILKELESAIGKTFEGWKGGDFTMSKDTPVWVANPGNSGDTAIIGVLNDGWRLILLTCYCEF
ncbi:MAG TPA: hypothetical protein VEA37_12770 [Flavobacterium sp.]|nr:hypothetical protein [Flavobacterium sp.]